MARRQLWQPHMAPPDTPEPIDWLDHQGRGKRWATARRAPPGRSRRPPRLAASTWADHRAHPAAAEGSTAAAGSDPGWLALQGAGDAQWPVLPPWWPQHWPPDA